MAYVIAKKPVFSVKKIEINTFEDGRWVKEELDATFHRKSTEDLDRLRNAKPADVLREVLSGLTGLKDGNGADVPFNPEDTSMVDALLAIPPLLNALVTAFWTHQVKGPEKN